MTTSNAPQSRIARILIVDDMPDNLFLMQGLLEDRFEVLQASSGKDALKIVLSQTPPDMVLLDIMMPDMDGYEVLRRMRQDPASAHIPVIFLTALDGVREEQLGLDLGALDYLTKPVDPDEVVRRVEAHVQATGHALRMEVLSERLSRHLPPEEWQALFHGEDLASIRFEEKNLTVLFAESGDLRGWEPGERDSYVAELEWLATRHGGTIDHFGWHGSVVFFEHPDACVHMAMDLQRSARELKLRMGIHTGLCDIATFRSAGEVRSTLLNADTGLAAIVAATAGKGSIVISPQAYALVQDQIHADTQGCILTEEFQDSGFATASLTPAPLRGGAASTFAGLGVL